MVKDIFFIILILSSFGKLVHAQPSSDKIATEASPVKEEKNNFDESKMQPLFFKVQDNELKFSDPTVSYDLLTSKGESLKIGPFVFNNDSVLVSIKDNQIYIKWDAKLSEGNVVTMYGAQGEKKWTHPISGVGEWLGPAMDSSEGPPIKVGERVSFCVMNVQVGGYSSLCSRWFVLKSKSKVKIFETYNLESQPRVFLNKEESKLAGNPSARLNSAFSFLASLKSGANFEFNSEPILPALRDLILSDDEKAIILTGEIPAPFIEEQIKIIPRETSDFIERRGPNGTIVKVKDLWEVKIPVDQKFVIFPGKTGGVFNFQMKVLKPALAKERRYLSDRALLGSYLEQDKTIVFDKEGKSYNWDLTLPKELELNRVFFDVPSKGITHQAYADYYRMAGREASLRLTGVLSDQGGTVFFAEGHFSWWFNDLFGWQDYYLSKQRWGISGKYFTSINATPVLIDGREISDVNISVSDFDLRYRIMPGLWERDQALGIILAHESTNIGDLSIPKFGFGAFWARPMPKIFDNIFGYLPYMNYPKWVDMEFISYSMSLDSKYELGSSDYVLNFHGKVLWTARFFGEAGFGIKSYNFSEPAVDNSLKMIALYGTVGIGYNF